MSLGKTEIGERILAARRAAGLSQKQVGEAVGLSQNGVMKIERGEIENSRFVGIIWQHLGLDMNELFNVGAAGESAEVTPMAKKVRALLIEDITYDEATLPDGSRGIMITWQVKSGTAIYGVMDPKLVRRAIPHFLRLAQDLGDAT